MIFRNPNQNTNMMLKKIFFGACLIGGAAMAGSCSGSANKADSETAAAAQEETATEFIRLNCVYNVGEERAAEAAELGRKLVAASQEDAGEMEYDMYESATRPGHFIIYETWKDQPSLDAHSASEHFTTIVPQMEAIAPLAVGRFGKTDTATEGEQIRINCMMSAKDGETDALLDTAMKLVAASQSDAGMIDYDIYRSVTRPRYFMIFETWKDQPSLDAHSAAEHFKTLVPRMHELSATRNTDIFRF